MHNVVQSLIYTRFEFIHGSV